MTVKKYTDIEIKNNIKNYTQKSFSRRILLLTGLVISLIFALNCDTNPFSFFSIIIVILFVAGYLLSEIVYHLNRKIAASNSYIEILVEQKKRLISPIKILLLDQKSFISTPRSEKIQQQIIKVHGISIKMCIKMSKPEILLK